MLQRKGTYQRTWRMALIMSSLIYFSCGQLPINFLQLCLCNTVNYSIVTFTVTHLKSCSVSGAIDQSQVAAIATATVSVPNGYEYSISQYEFTHSITRIYWAYKFSIHIQDTNRSCCLRICGLLLMQLEIFWPSKVSFGLLPGCCQCHAVLSPRVPVHLTVLKPLQLLGSDYGNDKRFSALSWSGWITFCWAQQLFISLFSLPLHNSGYALFKLKRHIEICFLNRQTKAGLLLFAVQWQRSCT